MRHDFIARLGYTMETDRSTPAISIDEVTCISMAAVKLGCGNLKPQQTAVVIKPSVH